VDNCRDNIASADFLINKIDRPLKESNCFFPLFAFEKLRAGGDQGIDKLYAVFPYPAPSRSYPVFYFIPVAVIRLYDMEIIFAFCRVDIGIAGILFFLPLMVGFQRPASAPFMLCKP
jgi:hypothetical protein